MKHKVLNIVSVLVVITLSGCSTISGGMKGQEISFKSKPRGVSVYHEAEIDPVGVTPFKLVVKPGDTGIFRFQKEGYKSQVIKIKKGVKKSTYANAALVPLYPIADFVDNMTNAKYEFKEKVINVAMIKNEEKVG